MQKKSARRDYRRTPFDLALARSGVFKRGSLGYGFIESDVVKAFFGRHWDVQCSEDTLEDLQQ